MRAQYIQQEWQAYPQAPKDCQSLHQFLRQPRAKTWVGGRLLWQDSKKLEGGHFLLSAFDQIVECEWQLPFVLMGKKNGEAKAMSNESLSEFFRYGDQVAVFVEQEIQSEQMQHKSLNVRILKISEMMLLAPAITEPKLENFNTAKKNAIHLINADIFNTAKKWQEFLQNVRRFFSVQGLQELTTTTLVECPGLEPTLEPFQTQWKMGGKEKTLFLPTSPEIQIKKKICQGATDVFEIKTCFRNEEKSIHHLPEFHMLEWYRAYSTLDAIEKDVENLVKFLSEKPVKIQRKSIAELMQKYLGFELTPQTTREQLQKLARDKGVETSQQDSWNDVFHRLWVHHVEPHLKDEGPMITYNYPPSQAALARTGKEGWIERFEFYWQGFELANAFHEVNDPHLQQQRWQQEIDEREHLGTTKLKIDEELIRLQHTGMPPTSGIALGLERLFMAINDIENIQEIWA